MDTKFKIIRNLWNLLHLMRPKLLEEPGALRALAKENSYFVIQCASSSTVYPLIMVHQIEKIQFLAREGHFTLSYFLRH